MDSSNNESILCLFTYQRFVSPWQQVDSDNIKSAALERLFEVGTAQHVMMMKKENN